MLNFKIVALYICSFCKQLMEFNNKGYDFIAMQEYVLRIIV